MSLPLHELILEASDYVDLEFNLKLTKSRIKLYSSEEWELFYETNKNSIAGLQENHEGLYIPNNYLAYLKNDSKFLINNAFHELFGHGLFCEHSCIGKNLVEIIHENKDNVYLLYSEINSNIQPYGLTKHNIWNYEGFAIWLEELLSKETNNEQSFSKKKQETPNEYITLLDLFKEAEEKLTRFGFMSQLGFPKIYSQDKLVNTIKQLYGPSFENIQLIVLYGSKKPESDIDLFVVSKNKSQNIFNGWLDIYELNTLEFNYMVSCLDISVTDPLFSGTLIWGDINQFAQIKDIIKTMPITQKAIAHNINAAEKQEELLPYFEHKPREKKICLSYMQSYKTTAQEFYRGNKVLTLKRIKAIT